MGRYLRSNDGHQIAFHHIDGLQPGVVFLGGFNSDMNGTKARALELWCQQRGRQFTRFDYYGHGQSEGTFLDGTIGQWKRDCLAIIDNVATGPLLLVGSSMGGWLMLLCALDRPDRVAGLLGIACAADFSERGIWASFSERAQKRIKREGVLRHPSDYQDEPQIISYQMIEEARQHLLLDDDIAISCPVTLVHGQEDRDVPYEISMLVAKQLLSRDVHIHLIKDGDHRLSSASQLREITRRLDDLIERI